MLDEKALHIYTDGSSYSNPRRGGVGVLYITFTELDEEVVTELSLPGYKEGTNNQMELYACIMGLRNAARSVDLKKYRRKIIHTDSKYVSENWKAAIYTWQSNEWKNASGRPVSNPKIWREFISELARCGNVDIQWCKGHSKDKFNKRVDKLAKVSANCAINEPLAVVSVRRKFSDRKVEPGCVVLKNQILKIRPITTEYLRTARKYKFKYEVLDEQSEFHGRVDFIYCSQLLKDGHWYEVQLGTDMDNPTIDRIIRELPKPRKDQFAKSDIVE